MKNRPPSTLNTIWNTLRAQYTALSAVPLSTLFAQDKNRFSRFSLDACGWLCDFSKHYITQETQDLLCKLAQNAKLDSAIDALFSGKPVNYTEERSAQHTDLRNETTLRALSSKHDSFLSVAQQLHKGVWLGVTQKPITDVVHIGIGGSYLGPKMVVEALNVYKGVSAPRSHFIANMDIADSVDVLRFLNPETTLFVVASKSFTTHETLENQAVAIEWLLARLSSSHTREAILKRHLLAVTANLSQALACGIPKDNIFTFPTSVGGRYSLWSSVGIVIAIAVGEQHFKSLLKGAGAMDNHFKTADFKENMPVMLGLLGLWYLDFFNVQTQAILPYSYALRHLSDYLQQLDMESNGKQTKRDGSCVAYPTGPIIWGGVGSNSQHAFHQLLFQGSHRVSIDFIVAAKSQWEHQYPNAAKRQRLLVAHCFTQSRSLMQGISYQEAYDQLIKEGASPQQAERLAPHKVVPGNQPSTTLLTHQLTPEALGALIALYEHKIFVQGVIWGINSFDQWGVELGKQQSVAILSALEGQLSSKQQSLLDASTRGLLDYVQQQR